MFLKKCFMSVHTTTKVGKEQIFVSCKRGKLSLAPCSKSDPLLFQIPSMTITPVNYIIVIAVMSNHNALPSYGYAFLRSYVEINK